MKTFEEITFADVLDRHIDFSQVFMLQPVSKDLTLEQVLQYNGGLVILSDGDETAPAADPSEEETPAEQEQKKSKKNTKPKRVDNGRIKALWKAGRSQMWIADDMHISQTTVAYWIRKFKEEVAAADEEGKKVEETT